MKRSTPVFLIAMVLVLPAMRPPENRPLARALQKEVKHLRKEVQWLKHTNRMHEKKLNSLQLILSGQKPTALVHFHKPTPTLPATTASNKIPNTGLRNSDTLALKAAINSLRQELMQEQIRQQQQQQVLQMMRNQLTERKQFLKDRSGLRQFKQAQKLLSATQSDLRRHKTRMLQRLKSNLPNNPWIAAQQQQAKLLQQLRNGSGGLPSNMQTKDRVNASMPKPVGDAMRRSEELQQQLSQIDSLRKANPDSSLHENPLRSVPWAQRFRFKFGWQVQQGTQMYPSAFEMMPGVRVSLTPNICANAALVFRASPGKSIEQLSFSWQGWGIQSDVSCKLYRNLRAGLIFRRILLPPAAEGQPPVAVTGLLPTLSMQGRLSVSVGYDLLYRRNVSYGNPLMLQFQF